jgi:hypothetical protein
MCFPAGCWGRGREGGGPGDGGIVFGVKGDEGFNGRGGRGLSRSSKRDMLCCC